jgi:hypothetical protein
MLNPGDDGFVLLFNRQVGAPPNWPVELPQMRAVTDTYGLSLNFVAAIRAQERGAPGHEFGISPVIAPTFADQLRVACITIAHRQDGWYGAMFTRVGSIAILSSSFIHWFASNPQWGGWAPVGAPNDPTNINQYWPGNVIAFQTQFAQAGGPG